MSGIYRAQSGQPFTIPSRSDYVLRQSGPGLPGLGQRRPHRPHSSRVSSTTTSMPRDFTSAAPGHQGQRRPEPCGCLRAWVNTWDLGLSKSFQIRERFGIQFRWEMFNAFNRKTLDINTLDTNCDQHNLRYVHRNQRGLSSACHAGGLEDHLLAAKPNEWAATAAHSISNSHGSTRNFFAVVRLQQAKRVNS